MDEKEQEIKAQGLFDLARLLDKDLIDKILKVSELVEFESLEDGTTKISVYLKGK